MRLAIPIKKRQKHCFYNASAVFIRFRINAIAPFCAIYASFASFFSSTSSFKESKAERAVSAGGMSSIILAAA